MKRSYLVVIEVGVIADDEESARELAFTRRFLDEADVVDIQDEGEVEVP